MEKDFLSNLCTYCTEDISFPQDKTLTDRFFQLEQEFLSHMGYDFVTRYQEAAGRLHDKEVQAAFFSGLQFAVQFMLTVFPPQSSSPSAP